MELPVSLNNAFYRRTKLYRSIPASPMSFQPDLIDMFNEYIRTFIINKFNEYINSSLLYKFLDIL